MPKSSAIQLGHEAEIPILYEDRSVFAIDKPAGWMLVPSHWDRTARNLQLAIDSSIRGRDFWAKSRNLRFLRFVHRLDADTTGVLLFVRSPGAVPVYSKLFESRQMEKVYLAVVEGSPREESWTVNAPLDSDPALPSRMRVDVRNGKEAITGFEVLERGPSGTLLLARPLTGRTHQIRVHLAHCGHAVLGDAIYGKTRVKTEEFPLALRSLAMSFQDPFTRRKVHIAGAAERFCRAFGFKPSERLAKLLPEIRRG